METIIVTYRGYQISYLMPPLMSDCFRVSIGSENHRLMDKLGLRGARAHGRCESDALANAKHLIDEVLRG
jgi:hypothetical protein